MRKQFKHLTFNDRLKMEVLLKAGHTPKEIALLLNKHISTIYREKNKGWFVARNSDETTELRYSPDIAQEHINEVLSAKGPKLKIDKERAFAARLEKIIVNDRYSPAAALAVLKEEGNQFSICVSTLYSYIEKGVFFKLTNKQLPVKCKKKKRSYNRIVRQARPSKGTSIEKRPERIMERTDFGHWEMDTVVGRQGISKQSILVLTERKTRKELCLLLKRHTTECVVKALNALEKRLGERNFRRVFKTITVDNGSEFQDYQGMQKSRRSNVMRTTIYYCHPYSSYERGSNENQNRMIRRCIPKGFDLNALKRLDIERVENWINNYPRRIFNYKTAEEMYCNELRMLGINP